MRKFSVHQRPLKYKWNSFSSKKYTRKAQLVARKLQSSESIQLALVPSWMQVTCYPSPNVKLRQFWRWEIIFYSCGKMQRWKNAKLRDKTFMGFYCKWMDVWRGFADVFVIFPPPTHPPIPSIEFWARQKFRRVGRVKNLGAAKIKARRARQKFGRVKYLGA